MLAESKSFINRRLHSLLGVIPVGAFLLNHLLTNYYATRGPEAFNEQVQWIQDLPFLLVLETLFIFLPILYHGIYGVYIAFQAKNNVSSFGVFRNYMFMLQRVTGLIAFVFIAIHVWQTRVQVALGNVETSELSRLMADSLSNPLWMTLYLIGLIATVFHFSNGLWSFFVSWGITVGPRAQRAMTYVCMVVFVLVSYVGVRAIFAFVDPQFIDQLASL